MLKRLLSIVLSVVLVLSGVCIGSPGSYAADEETNRGLKVLKVAWRGDPNTLCHVTSPIASLNTPTHELMMDRLFEYDYASGQLMPMLATGWEQLSDRTFRVTLRNDVYSWNGDKFKASDVLYTIQSAIDSGAQARYYGIFDTDNFVVEDDTHIVIALKNPDPFIQYTLSNIQYGMLCEASVTAAGGLENISGSEAALPNCYTGPYKPVEWELGSHIKFVKNTDYWGAEPYYDEIIVYSIQDAYSRAQALTNGTVDLALMPPEDLASNIENNSELDVYAYPTNQQVTLFMNTQSAPFDDVNLRISCALALNYENNIQVALGGYAEHSDDILAKKNIQYTSPSAEDYESYFHYDQEEVAEYMQDSPYYGTNPTVELYYTPEFAAYAALVQQQWSAIGINVVLTEKAQTEYFSIMSSGEYQAYIVKNSNPDPYEQLKFYDGGHFNYRALNGGPQWNGGEGVTALFDSITSAYSMQAAAPYYKQLRRIINDNVPSVPLYTPYTMMYGKKGLTGLGLTLMGDPYITRVRGTEQSGQAALPAVVDVYTTSVANSMGSMTDVVQVDYWREKYPDTTFNLIYGEMSIPENIDQFAALGKTDGSAVLLSNPGQILAKYQEIITNDLSDRSVFKAVSSSVNSVQPQSLVLICRSDETRFSNIEELVDYIDSHPGEIKVGYLKDSQYEFFVKNLLTVLGVSGSDIQLASDSIPNLRSGVMSGTYDVIPLTNSTAEADISSGRVKGILHDALTREGYPYNKEFLQGIPILTEVSVIDPSDYEKVLIELPNTVYVSAGTPSELCELFNHATDGILENESFAQRIAALGSMVTYQYYTLDQIDALQHKVAGQIQTAIAYGSAPAAYLSYGTDQYTRNDDDVVYDFILGDFEELMDAAKAKTDLDEKYAAYAKAEAELLDSAVIIPTATNSGKATTFAGTLNVNRGSFVLPNGNAASNKTESEKISAAVALSNRNFRKALQFAFDKDSYYAVNYGEYYNSGILRNIFTAPELVSLSKQVEADGHVFAAGTTYGQMVQYYLTAAGSHINAEDGQDGWYDPAAAVQTLNAAKAELGTAVSYPIVIDYVYNSDDSREPALATAYKQSIEQTLGSGNVRVDLIPANQNDYYDCAYWVDYGSKVDLDFFNGIGWASENNDPLDFLDCFTRNGWLIIDLGLSAPPASETGIYGVTAPEGKDNLCIELGDSVTLIVDSTSMYSNPRQVKWYCADTEEGTLIEDCGVMTTGIQTLEVQPDTFTTYYCEVEDSFGTTRAIYFYVAINNGLTIAPKDNEYVKYFETGKDVLIEVEASADRGSLSYVWEEIGDSEVTLLGITDVPCYLLNNVSAEKTISCTAWDDYGNRETVNMGLIPVDVEISASENVLSVGTGSEDNNVAGSAVPDEVLSAAVESGQSVTVNIVVSSENASDIPASEITAIEDKIAEAFPGDSSESISYVTIDLNYTVGDAEPEPITETSEALEITISVPNAEEGKQYIVVRMHNGRAEVVPSVYEYDPETNTGTITITSDKFSTYAIRQVESFYTVEFDTLGGTSMPSRILGTGSYIAPLPVPEKTGYVFNGWECVGEAFSIDTTVSSALDPDNDGTIVLTAKWIPAQYEVTFETNGGSAVEPQLVEYLGKAERPQDPVQEDFIFAGWTDAEGNPFSFNTLIKGNITLYAQWDVDPASIVETYPIWFNYYPSGIYAGTDPETGDTVFYDQTTGEKVETRIQVTSKNLNDVLGDGGSIQYDPDNSILQFSDPDFGTSSFYGYNGEYSALVVGDTYVALVGSARIPTVYSEYSDSTMAFNGDFRISSQYGALYTAGTVVVQGGSLYAGCNSIPIEAERLVIYGGEVTADAPMAIAVRTYDCIRVEGGSLIASGAANEPAIYTDGYIAVSVGLDDPAAGRINASVYTFPGEDPSSYDTFEGLEYRMIAIDGITLSGVGIAEPAQGKVSKIQYHTYDIYGDLQPCDAYAVTKADGSASAVVRIEPIDMTVYLRTAYLSLEGKISINFKVQAPDAGYVARLYYEKAGFEQVAEVPLNSDHFVADPANYDYYLVTYSEVPAKEMTQQLRIKVFDADGNQLPMKISSGYIDQYDYSVAKWCTNMINKNTNANDVMIAKALLNYGHYSQLALKYNDGRENRPNNMPAAWLESEMGSVTANSAYDRITDGGKALGAKSFILVLESDTLIKLVLSRPVSVSIDGTPVTLAPETDSSGNAIWAAYSSGVAAKRLHERKALTLTEGGNSATLYYGVLSWANSKLANGNEDDQNLARAMYLYNAAARRYFHYDEAGLQ